MKEKQISKFSRVLLSFLVVFFVMVISCLIDYLMQSAFGLERIFSCLSKIIYGTLWGFVFYLIFSAWDSWLRALLVSLLVTLFLHGWYLWINGPNDLMVLVFFAYFIPLFLISWVVFYLFEREFL